MMGDANGAADELAWGRAPLSFSPRLHNKAWRLNTRRRYNRPRFRRASTGVAMAEEHTTAAVQRYLDELAGDSPAEPVVRALLDRAVRRLHQLCAALLYRNYPRLTRPPAELASGRAARRRGGAAAQGAARGPPGDRRGSSSPWPVSTCDGS